MLRNYRIALLFSLLLTILSSTNVAAQTINILHFSDYHSNAVPTANSDGIQVGGIARLIHLLRQEDSANTLIFSGGDMMNKGSPAWSDKYQCAEWPWFNGLLDAMALGNHESDYGADVFSECQTATDYPIISSNVLLPSGAPLLSRDGKDYLVYAIDSIKIGVISLAGPDFVNLLKPATLPAPGVSFADRIETAKKLVSTLKDIEKVDAVVLIGHAHYEDDIQLAQQVDGIDLILGTHSHRKQELMQIENTKTWYISPFQYLSHVSKVSLRFEEGQLRQISGGLIALDENIPEDPETAEKVANMQAALEKDPLYAHKFKILGDNPSPLSAPTKFDGESILGNFVTDLVRAQSKANVVLMTSSTFRKSIPAGTIKEYHLTDALPYENKIFIHELSGKQLEKLLNYSVSRSGSDFFSQVSGARFAIEAGAAGDIKIRTPAGSWRALDPMATYQVATSDFQSLYADGYKQFFIDSDYQALPDSLWTLVRKHLRSPVSMSKSPALLDGRIKNLDVVDKP